MKKKLILATVFIVVSLLIFGMGKLYISYNLSRYVGYYIQHMPRKEGVKPELAVVIDNLHDIDEPKNSKVYYDLDGNESIQSSENNIAIYHFSVDNHYILQNFDTGDSFAFNFR